MVNWRHWDIYSLFKNPDDLPLFWELALENASESDKLQLFELFQPVHRLLDFWAVQKDDFPFPISPLSWNDDQWSSCLVYLNPVLCNDKVKQDLISAIAKKEKFQISSYIPLPASQHIFIDNLMGACLLLLWEKAQPLSALVERWLMLQPLNPITLEIKPKSEAYEEIKSFLTQLETFTYILLELEN